MPIISSLLRKAAALLLIAYLLAVVVVLLNGTPWIGSGAAWVVWAGTVHLGLPPTIANPGRAEFLANVVLLIPLTALASIVWPRSTWRDWTAWAFVISLGAEAVQAFFLPGRSATFSDVVANTLGGAIGAVVVAVLAWPWRRRGEAPGLSPGLGTSSPGGSEGA